MRIVLDFCTIYVVLKSYILNKILLNTYRKTNEDGKVFLHKLETFLEIKREFIEKLDFNIIGDQLGLKHELEVVFYVFSNSL